MKKSCTKKCKPCKGRKCANFNGSANDLDFSVYYEGILNSREINFSNNNNKKKPPMDKGDWTLVYFLIVLTLLLTLTGGLLC